MGRRLQPATLHLLGEALDAGDVALDERRPDEGSATAGAIDPPFAHQLTEGVTDGDQAAAIACRQLALGRQPAAGAEFARFEGSLQVEIHLVVQRDRPNLELEPCHRPPSTGSRHRNA